MPIIPMSANKYHYAVQDGETARYRCDAGYQIEGQGNKVRRIDLTCNVNETHAMWDGPQPRCERKLMSNTTLYMVSVGFSEIT